MTVFTSVISQEETFDGCLTSLLFTQHAPSLFELFLVDLALGEPFLENVERGIARRCRDATVNRCPLRWEMLIFLFKWGRGY